MKNSMLCTLFAATALALPLCAQAQGAGNAPFAGAAKMTTEQALKEAPKDDPALAPLDKAMKDADAKLKKTPKDAKLQKAYVEATYKYGHTAMLDNKLSALVRYRAALALYRRALVVDPKHKESLADKKQIEDIYKQMGREIPK